MLRERIKLSGRSASFSLKVSLSYIVFLLLCLVLAVVLYTSSTQSARDNYWQGRMTELERAASAMAARSSSK